VLADFTAATYATTCQSSVCGLGAFLSRVIRLFMSILRDRRAEALAPVSEAPGNAKKRCLRRRHINDRAARRRIGRCACASWVCDLHVHRRPGRNGQIVAAEEERFSRRMHGIRREPFTAWEPERTARWCDFAGLDAGTLDAIAGSSSVLTHPAAVPLHDPCCHLEGPTPATRRRLPAQSTGSVGLVHRAPAMPRMPLLPVSCAVPEGCPPRGVEPLFAGSVPRGLGPGI
jgi:hypothetical protein